jgi:hypothetical protein
MALLAKSERELGGERGGRTIAGFWAVAAATLTAMGAYLEGPTGRLASLTPLPRTLTLVAALVFGGLSLLRLGAPSAPVR